MRFLYPENFNNVLSYEDQFACVKLCKVVSFQMITEKDPPSFSQSWLLSELPAFDEKRKVDLGSKRLKSAASRKTKMWGHLVSKK